MFIVSIYLKFCVIQLWLHPLSDRHGFLVILPTSKEKSTENLGIMGHFPSSSYGLGISYRLLQAPFCGFSSKKEVSSILLLKKWYSEFEGRPKRAYAVKQKSLPEAEEILSKSAKQMLAL